MVHALKLRSLVRAAREWVGPWAERLLALAVPSNCLLCRAPLAKPLAGPLCEGCRDRFPRLGHAHCDRCGLPYGNGAAPGLCGPCRGRRSGFRRARSAGLYEDTLREVIHQFKYRGRHRLAEPLGRWVWDRCLSTGALDLGAALVPVPLSRRRQRERGYNQSELLAMVLARLSGRRCRRLLRKKGHRPPQAGLGVAARRRNAAGAYHARLPAAMMGSSLLLVDDVLTTGATAEACARALLRAGASAVDVVTVARVR